TTATEQLLEQLAEVEIDLLEGIAEPFARAAFDFAQRFFSSRDSLRNVVALNRQESESLVRFGQFFQRHHVDRAKVLQPVPQIFNARSLGFKIEFRLQGYFIRNLFEALIQFIRT